MSLDISSLKPIIQSITSITALGIVCFLAYNLWTGAYKKENFINVIKYCFAFAAGYFLLKGFIDSKHTISFTSSKISTYQNITVVGVWVFSFNWVARIAQSISSLISAGAMGTATSILAVLFSGIALHSRLALNAWRGPSEVFEAFVFGIIAYVSMAYFDVFYDSITLFLDSSINSLFEYNIYERYSESMNPIFQANIDFTKNLISWNIAGSISNIVSMILGGITMTLLIILDLMNLLLYSLQYIGLMFLPIFVMAVTFFSGLDPTKPLKLCGAFAIMSLLAKTQVIILNMLFSSFSNNDIFSYSAASTSLNFGLSLAADNLLLIVKVAIAVICSTLIVVMFSKVVLGKMVNVIFTNQFIPMASQAKNVINILRK